MAWKQARESPRPPRSDTFNPGKASAKAKRPGYLSVMRAASDTRSSLSLSLDTLDLGLLAMPHTHRPPSSYCRQNLAFTSCSTCKQMYRCTKRAAKDAGSLWTMLRTCYLSPCLTLTQCLGAPPQASHRGSWISGRQAITPLMRTCTSTDFKASESW